MCPQFVALNNKIKAKIIYGKELFRGLLGPAAYYIRFV